MPVNVDKNLTLKNNTMDATYGELFYKLNKAYAWTHTQSTIAGGTAAVIYNREIYNTLQCSDINKVFVPYQWSTWNNFCIIDGKLYTCYNGSLQQIGNDTNWKICTNTSRINNNPHVLVINDNGELYRFSNVNKQTGVYTSITQIGNDMIWNQITCVSDYGADNYSYGISNGKLYCISGTSYTQVGTDTTWIKVLNNFAINNGFIYKLSPSDASVQLISSNNDFYDIFSIGDYGITLCAVSSSGKLYAYYNDSLKEVIDIPLGIKKVYLNTGSGNYLTILTTSGEIYTFNNSSITVVDDKIKLNLNNLDSNIFWSDVIGISSNLMAIGDGKLYKVTRSNNVYTYEIIDNNSNYKKLEGTCSTYGVALAWTDDATTVSHTVYTTKSPQANDATYIDEDLTKYSTIQSVGGTTVTDEYRTYDRDASKDSTFTAIPTATMHETVSTIDFLRITNPNT